MRQCFENIIMIACIYGVPRERSFPENTTTRGDILTIRAADYSLFRGV